MPSRPTTGLPVAPVVTLMPIFVNVGSVPVTRYRVKQAPTAAQRPRITHLWLHRTPTIAAGLSAHFCCHGLFGHRYPIVKTVVCLIIGTLPKSLSLFYLPRFSTRSP